MNVLDYETLFGNRNFLPSIEDFPGWYMKRGNAIWSMAYSSETQTLAVEYTAGSVYYFFDISKKEFEDIQGIKITLSLEAHIANLSYAKRFTKVRSISSNPRFKWGDKFPNVVKQISE